MALARFGDTKDFRNLKEQAEAEKEENTREQERLEGEAVTYGAAVRITTQAPPLIASIWPEHDT